MKKALALVLALVLALSMAVSAFAAELVVLNKVPAAAADIAEIEVVEWDSEILYTNAYIDVENVAAVYGTEYYIALEDLPYTDIKLTANGIVTAELVKYDPATMDIDGIEVVFDVVNKAGDTVNTFSGEADYEAYKAAVKEAKALNADARANEYSVKVVTNVNIIKVTVEDNFTAAYTKGTLKIEAKLYNAETKKYDAYAKTLTVINDVTIFEYEEVKYAAANNEDGAYLQLGALGYSDYVTAQDGYSKYGEAYNYEALRNTPAALVVSTTAFRAIEGKDLTVAVCPALEDVLGFEGRDAEITVTLKDIAAGQKGVNFFAWAEIEDVYYKSETNYDRYPSAVSFGFLGNQVIKGAYEINVLLPINYYELREIFGLKVEEEDIINYYVVDENNNVVKTIKVDYMTHDITELVEFTVEGANETLGWYTLCLEVPAVESEGEANPNTGAESVVGVVAALAVVSVATAAAVSLKK